MTQTESAILAHARRCVPAESCGFVVRTPEGERYIPCVNISAEPEAYFRIAPEDWLRAEMQGEIVALVHSHPGGLPWLSEADRRLQVQSDLPWWLVCRGAIHKFRCVPHLTGRRFEHGVTDCYTLFRDAYHLAGIEMPDFHREDDWWRNGQNLYLDNLEATGLYQVPLSSAQPGDVLLCCFGSSVPNHAAIYCGDSELLHHIPEQLSKRERYTDKWQRRTHSLWRHRAWRAAIGAGGMTGILFSLGASMVLGGVAQMLAPKARTPRTQTTDNGKQNTYFSSLDNMVAQGNVLPVLYGEMRVGSRVVSQEISTADEGDGGQVVVIGR
ncbi:Mov34/MPN/PAD-1 family protein [Escherichia coli]|nr:Mov34/MPN/PAD-1 family protein [Escherichia coli]EHT7268372.1 Mov34/MPN/PAD-1 family protein [Escherichia coli]